MDIDRPILWQPVGEVRAAMDEERCGDCFGCPIATVVAAQLVFHTNLLVGHVDATKQLESDIIRENEQAIVQKRAELSRLTGGCTGYSDTRTKDTPRPAKMCNSPNHTYPRISLLAGKLVELFEG